MFYIEVSITKDRPGEEQWYQFVQNVPGVFPAPCFPSRNLNKEIEDRTDTKPHWLTDLPYALYISVNCFQLWLIIFPTKNNYPNDWMWGLFSLYSVRRILRDDYFENKWNIPFHSILFTVEYYVTPHRNEVTRTAIPMRFYFYVKSSQGLERWRKVSQLFLFYYMMMMMILFEGDITVCTNIYEEDLEISNTFSFFFCDFFHIK